MRLSGLLGNTVQLPIELDRISMDGELIADIQGQLALACILDPPIDRTFGPVTRWALKIFAAKHGLQAETHLDRDLVAALLSPQIADTFPLTLGTDIASDITHAIRTAGYWMCRQPDCINIVYIEGMDPDGAANNNAPNVFNDARVIITFDPDGRPKMIAWEATSEPGRYYTLNPEPPKDHLPGVARIALDQFKAWSVGIHRPNTPSAHEALVQVAKINVCRDLNQDYKRAGDAIDTGIFGINQHAAFDLPHNNIARSSAGCLVGRVLTEHQAFMKKVKADARYLASNAYRFQTTILPRAALG
jgi:peptidoglycan hydrolase-like protein with peptidoglycan-binding domain